MFSTRAVSSARVKDNVSDAREIDIFCREGTAIDADCSMDSASDVLLKEFARSVFLNNILYQMELENANRVLRLLITARPVRVSRNASLAYKVFT